MTSKKKEPGFTAMNISGISKKERFDTLVSFLSSDTRLVTGPEEIAIYQEFDPELARLATVAGDAILAMVKHVQRCMLDGKVGHGSNVTSALCMPNDKTGPS